MASQRAALTLAHWFKQASGCSFAASFASKGIDGRIHFSTLDALEDGDLEDVNTQLEALGRRSRAACLVFPNIDTSDGFAVLLTRLTRDPRWRMREHSRDERNVLLILEWRTEQGPWSRTMGLAPMLSMPATRRTPYVAIALWPGPPRKKKDWVGFIDMPSGLEPEPHQRALDTSQVVISDILGDDRGAHWRDVAFRIPRSTYGAIEAAETPPSG